MLIVPLGPSTRRLAAREAAKQLNPRNPASGCIPAMKDTVTSLLWTVLAVVIGLYIAPKVTKYLP